MWAFYKSFEGVKIILFFLLLVLLSALLFIILIIIIIVQLQENIDRFFSQKTAYHLTPGEAWMIR